MCVNIVIVNISSDLLLNLLQDKSVRLSKLTHQLSQSLFVIMWTVTRGKRGTENCNNKSSQGDY